MSKYSNYIDIKKIYVDAINLSAPTGSDSVESPRGHFESIMPTLTETRPEALWDPKKHWGRECCQVVLSSYISFFLVSKKLMQILAHSSNQNH
ncbi:MAG: hypothetical protein WEA58_13880 [Balneolaceae bacterium]